MAETTEAYGFTFAFPAGDTAVGACLRDYGEFGLIGSAIAADLSSGGLFVDVGANIGAYALPVSRRARQVLAIEAHPGLADLLARNVRDNGVTNVEVLNAAADAASGVLSFPCLDLGKPANFGAGGIGHSAAPASPVRAVALDDVVGDEAACVKIDVEGWEMPVLAGARRLLERVRPYWIIEVSSPAIIETMTDAGYRAYWFWDPFVTPAAPKAQWTGPRRGDLSIIAVDRALQQPAGMVEALPGDAPPRDTAGFTYLRNFGIPEFSAPPQAR